MSRGPPGGESFYRRRWPETVPDFEYLNDALRQTGHEDARVTEANWRELVAARIREVDRDAVKRDLAPFVLRPGDLDVFEAEFVLRLL